MKGFAIVATYKGTQDLQSRCNFWFRLFWSSWLWCCCSLTGEIALIWLG